jgi:ABC-type uncharacterized transport system fused permease/ATPase subunit
MTIFLSFINSFSKRQKAIIRHLRKFKPTVCLRTLGGHCEVVIVIMFFLFEEPFFHYKIKFPEIFSYGSLLSTFLQSERFLTEIFQQFAQLLANN